MKIFNSTIDDIDDIFKLYETARDFQKIKGAVLWPKFNRDLIETEISENRQWKIVINGQIACVWAITFNDPEIWEEKDLDPSIYIHRIATNPDFRGKNLVGEIINWSKNYAKKKR